MKNFARLVVVVLNRVLICPTLFVLHKTLGLRISFLKEYRIAHFAWNTQAYYYHWAKDPEAREHKRQLIFGGAPCNWTLFKIWKRHLPIIESRLACFWFNADMPYLYSKEYVRHLPFHHTEFKEIDQAPALVLSNEEERKGERLLEEMGMRPDDWFMCFQSRDEAYRQDILKGPDPHAHKFADIDSYLDAARLITGMGGYAIRMGFGVKKALAATDDPKILDYATHHRSDFGDIYLPAKCRFFISSPGLMAISTLFKVPLIIANMLPPRVWPIGERSLMMPKLLKDSASGDFVPFSEIQAHGMLEYTNHSYIHWDRDSTYAENGLVPYDNEPVDLVNACHDIMNKIDGIPADPEARELQAYYKRMYCASVPDANMYGPDIAPSFILKHKDVFLN